VLNLRRKYKLECEGKFARASWDLEERTSVRTPVLLLLRKQNITFLEFKVVHHSKLIILLIFQTSIVMNIRTFFTALVVVAILHIPSVTMTAQSHTAQNTAQNTAPKPHALHIHAHSQVNTKVSPCVQEGLVKPFSPENIISDKVPCPGNSMGIQAEPHLDPKELMSKVVYPKISKAHRKEAWVSLVVLVDDKGKYNRHILECVKAFNPASTKWDLELAVEEIQALEGSAVVALQSVTFEPAQRDGKPLQCWTSIPIHYRLP
jgi:hypothetical protein